MLDSNHLMTMTETSEYLEHHGIMGMKWGKRNGPPYPLRPEAHSASEKKANWKQSLSGNGGDRLEGAFDRKVAKAEEKKRKAREKSLAKARKAQQKKREEEMRELKRMQRDVKQAAKIQKMKEKLLRKGDIEEIDKKSKYFTNEELRYAHERYNLMQNTKKLANPEKPQQQKQEPKKDRTKAADSLQWIANNLGTVAKISTAVLTTVTSIEKLKNMGAGKADNAVTQNKEKSSKDTIAVKENPPSKKTADTPVSKIPNDFSPKEVSKLFSEASSYSQDLKPGKTKSFTMASDTILKSYSMPVSSVKKQEYSTPTLDFTVIRDMSVNSMPKLDMSSLQRKGK